MRPRRGGNSLPLEGIIFDFDLTLADSTAAAVDCINYALEKLGFPPVSLERGRRTIGLSLEDGLELLTGIEDPRIAARFGELFVERADTIMVDRTELFSGVPAILRELQARGLRLAIASTKYRCRIEAILERHRVREVFTAVVGGEDIRACKPDPESLELALRALGTEREAIVYVGDHPVDAQAAEHARIAFIAVCTGHTSAAELRTFPHRAVLPDLSALPGIIAGWV